MDPVEKRGLLYGLLALKIGFVNVDQLVETLSAWNLKSADDDLLPSEFFVERSLLTSEQARAVENVFALHVASGDCEELDHSLETLASFEVSDAIGKSERQGASDIQETLQQLKTSAQTGQGIGDTERNELNVGGARQANTHVSDNRFKVIRPLESGKGGMGEIDVAEDAELGRHVALKKIRPEQADKQASRDRFRREAEITGNLEHPSIVPIYGLGSDASGRPYYAMRWIRGNDLGMAIEKFHADREQGSTSFDTIEFRALIDQLIDVAQAISYAHSRGVLHRDLKPNNVMVGKYGETLVIDWGLARLPDQDDFADANGGPLVENAAEDEPLVLSGSHTRDLPHTAQGSIMGTVGYAPPEQLDGSVDRIGPYSDVYGLGAILYQILTGKAPVQTKGMGLKAAVEATLRGRIEPPGAVASGVPKSLAAICMKSLEREPSERYSNASQLIDELERWKADQPVEARNETLIEKLGRFARKHRAATVAGTIALVTISLVSSIALVEVDRQRGLANDSAVAEKDQRLVAQRAQQKAESLASSERIAREKADRLAVSERKAKEEAAELAERNQDVVDFFVNAFRSADPENKGVTHEMTAKEVLNRARRRFDGKKQLQRDPLAKATLLKALGDSFVSLGDYEAAAECLEIAFEIQSKELGEEDNVTLISQNNLAVAYHHLGESSRCIELNEKLLVLRQKTLGKSHQDTLTAINNLAAAKLQAGDLHAAAESFELVLERLVEKFEDSHKNVTSTRQNLANCYRELGRFSEAVELMRQVYQARKEKLGAKNPHTIVALDNLALALAQNGAYEEAHEGFLTSYELSLEKLGKDHPSTLTSIHNLANSYQNMGELEKARTLFNEVVQRRQMVLGEEHPRTLVSLNNLASVLLDLGELDRSTELNQKVLRLRQKVLGKAHPFTLSSMNNLATSLTDQGKLGAAKKLLQSGVEIQEKTFGRLHPTTLAFRINLARVIERLDGPADARGMLQMIVKDSLATLGEQHPTTLSASECLASNYMLTPATCLQAKEILGNILQRSTLAFGNENRRTQRIKAMLEEAEALIPKQD